MEKKVMSDYTLFCTEEQTQKALELGAPIPWYKNTYTRKGVPSFREALDNGEWLLYICPTAEQMCGWLLEQIDDINVCKKSDGTWFYIFYPDNTIVNHLKEGYSSHKEATLAAIDAALNYLIEHKSFK